MKQFFAVLIILASSVFPLSVLAAGSATMKFSQENLTLSLGQTIDVMVNVDPKGENLDTVRSIFTFDPTMLKVESVVRLGSFDRSTPGNFIDNKNGLVSWGGFTLEGPNNTVGEFLKISISGRQVGSSTILFSDDSKAISGGEEKINLSQFNELKVTIQEEQPADPGLSALTVNSSSHPQELNWYTSSTVDLDWVELKGESEVTAYYYAFDEASNTNPTTYLSAAQTTRQFEKVADGIHYFHIKGVQKNGKTTQTVHRRVQIDTQNPNPLEITVSEDQLIEGESLWLTFATTDDLSGVEQYKVAINTSEFLPQQSPLEITDLVPGTYFIRVAALDRAGNVVNQGQSIRVYSTGTQLDRPEGFSHTNEIDALTTFTSESQKNISKNLKLLITLALVLVVVFGIIYTIKKLKK